MVFGKVLSLNLLLALVVFDAARGNDLNVVNCDTKLDSAETCELTEIPQGDFGKECFMATLTLSENLTDELNYTMYVNPIRGFNHVKVFFLDQDRSEQTSLMVSRHLLQNEVWQQLTLTKEIHPTGEQYRWVFGDSLSKYLPRWKRTSSIILAAKGPLTWTDGCDPRTSASIMKPSSEDATKNDGPTEGVTELIVALSSAAGIVIFIVVIIIIIQNRRQKQTVDDKSMWETTTTTTIDFPSRPAPPLPMKTDAFTISPYAKVCDEADPVYEEVYTSGKAKGTLPLANTQLMRTLDGYPTETGEAQFRPTPPPVNLRLLKTLDGCSTETEEDKDCPSERESINSLYMSAFDAV